LEQDPAVEPSENGKPHEPLSAADLHAQGVEQGKNGEYVRAVELLVQAAALKPSIPAIHLDLGESYRLLGEFKRAEGSCRTALMLLPTYAMAHNTLGLIFRDQERLPEAVEEFHRAIELRPNLAQAHNNLGVVLKDLDQVADAMEHFRRAIEIAPDLFHARINLGLALMHLGRADEALPYLQEVVRTNPELPLPHQSLGNALRILNRNTDARKEYLEAIRLKQDLPVPHLHIGMTLRSESQFREALPWLKQAVQLNADNAFAWEQLAEVHGELDEPGDAIPCWERVLALAPKERARIHLGLGSALQDEGRVVEAKEQFLIAQRLQPEMPMAHVRLGGAHEILGDMAAAEAAFRTAVRLEPNFPPPHARLATLLRDKLPDSDLAALQERLADLELAQAPRARLQFGLAHVLDARGDFAGAADCLREANAISLELARGTSEYFPADHERFINNMLGVFDDEFFERTAGMGHDSCRPVFVVGMPRSGTTLIEQVLSSHPQIHGAGELRIARKSFEAIPATLARPGPPMECVQSLTSEAIHLVATQHLAKLEALDGGKADRIVDKMPDNYNHLGLLTTLFPNAVFIHCRRDLRDVAVSCWMTDFGSIRWANDQGQLASRIQGYQRIMDHWETVLRVPVLDVHYEETVADLEGVARRLIAACGLEWDPVCLDFYRSQRAVRTASHTQVRQPIYTKSVARWKNYEHALGDLFAALPLEEEALV